MSYLFIFKSESSFSKKQNQKKKKLNSKLYFKAVVINNKVVPHKTMSCLESCGLMAGFVLCSLHLVPCFPGMFENSQPLVESKHNGNRIVQPDI